MAVPLQPVPEKPRPDKGQQITKPPKKEEPELVNAAPPGRLISARTDQLRAESGQWQVAAYWPWR